MASPVCLQKVEQYRFRAQGHRLKFEIHLLDTPLSAIFGTPWESGLEDCRDDKIQDLTELRFKSMQVL